MPDFSTDSNKFELAVYDKTHLGSNLRKALYLDKIDGISKSAWENVAENHPSILNISLIEINDESKIMDQMKEKLARSLFTEDIEKQIAAMLRHILEKPINSNSEVN